MGKRVLVVDDAKFMRSMVTDVLERFGFEICGEAADGGEAVEKWKELRPDVTTLDIVMPTVDGIEALRRIMKEDANAKVIMLTAIDQRESLKEALKLGALDFIVKPFDEDAVVAAVKKATES
ncbi:MAG: response regulator [Candidatus Lindowbacteria bacterium]|nr:response regulator [Candidatus Lindowbacteria bacterium]